MEKQCFKCLRVLPVENFYIHSSGVRVNKCKECSRQEIRAYRLKRLEYYRERNLRRNRSEAGKQKRVERGRRWRAANPGVVAERSRAMRAKFPEKHRARDLVRAAIRSGRLVRQPCEVCAAEQGHAHHDDYSKPLVVRWLCRTHHGEHHRIYG